jgi:hypothetical protein
MLRSISSRVNAFMLEYSLLNPFITSRDATLVQASSLKSSLLSFRINQVVNSNYKFNILALARCVENIDKTEMYEIQCSVVHELWLRGE